MEMTNVFKVVIMEDLKTSSTVWTQFIKADSNHHIQKYVENSGCKIIYCARLDVVEVAFTDKPIDMLVNGEMVYASNKGR